MRKFRPGYVSGASCLGKLNFHTMENGQRCADNANRSEKNAKWGKFFTPYPCNICGGVHHTSNSKEWKKTK